MVEKGSDEQWAESLKTLLSGSSIKIEPPIVMATSPALSVRLNINTLLNLTYDLLTRGNFQDEKPGVRYEERSTQTSGGKASVRSTKSSKSFDSVGLQANDLSEVEKRELLERHNRILMRSILDCHMQYTRHKHTCHSCPPLTLPKELQELYQQRSGEEEVVDDATEMYSTSPSPPSPIAGEPPSRSASSYPDRKPSSGAADVTADMDVDLDAPPEPMGSDGSHPSEMGGSSSISVKSSRSSPTIPSHQTTAISRRLEASVELVDASDDGNPVLDLTLPPTFPAPHSPAVSSLPEVDVSQEDDNEQVPEPRPRVVVSELWWREQMNEVVMNRFQGTRLLECHTCETAPNPGYKSFHDDEEDLNEQIQVHFEEKHPDESYVLKRCSNAHLETLRSLR